MINMKNVAIIDSVLTFIDYIQKYYKTVDPKKHLFFRGHSKVSYELIPSVFRKNESEKDILLDFKQYAPEHNIKYDFIYECDRVLNDMQHFGLPTRLLDWAINPLIALYFSCQRSKTLAKEDKDEDGRIFIFNPWNYNSKIVNYEIPENHDIHILARALLSYGWNFDDIGKYIERKYVRFELNEKDLEKPISFVSPYTNKMKISQRGCFTINGTDRGSLDKWDEEKKSLDYLTIRGDKKYEILNELNLLYINEYSVYPDFDGMSEMIKKWGSLFNYKLKK